jgi:hypothetical protein
MKRWMFLTVLLIPLLFSCKKADIDTYLQIPQFTEFYATSSSYDNSKFFSSSIEINKGESVTIGWTIIDAETLEYYTNDQSFIERPVERYEHAGYGFPEGQIQNSLVFKLVAINRNGMVEKEVKIIVR